MLPRRMGALREMWVDEPAGLQPIFQACVGSHSSWPEWQRGSAAAETQATAAEEESEHARLVLAP